MFTFKRLFQSPHQKQAAPYILYLQLPLAVPVGVAARVLEAPHQLAHVAQRGLLARRVVRVRRPQHRVLVWRGNIHNSFTMWHLPTD